MFCCQYLSKLLYFVTQRTAPVLQARIESGLETPEPSGKVINAIATTSICVVCVAKVAENDA